jgi:hypothetical protein
MIDIGETPHCFTSQIVQQFDHVSGTHDLLLPLMKKAYHTYRRGQVINPEIFVSNGVGLFGMWSREAATLADKS